MTPEPNPDGTYLPMRLTGARRIERERQEYRERQRLHTELFPDYEAGFRRPSVTTAGRVAALIGQRVKLTQVEQQALTVILDAAVQAGEDHRLLTTNLLFDVLASGWSDCYRSALKRGPARLSYEMAPETLKTAWRDLLRNDIYIEKLLPLVRRGLGLYRVKRGQDDKYSVELTEKTEALRAKFLRLIGEDATNGGTYRRRSSLKRPLLASKDADDTLVDDVTDAEDPTETVSTRKIVAEHAYNVATPGPRSTKVIGRLESTRLYLNAQTTVDEFTRLEEQRDEIDAQLWDDYRLDVTKSNVRPSGKRLVTDAGSGKVREGQWLSKRERHIRQVLRRHRAAELTIHALVKAYDKLAGQARQLKRVVKQLEEMKKAGEIDHQGDIEIKSRFVKLSNRRYQALDFWLSEMSGKKASEQVETTTVPILVGYEEGHEIEGEIDVRRRTTRRGRLFRVAVPLPADGLAGGFVERRDLVGADVSGSQIQILAVLLGLTDLEAKCQERPYKEIAAIRAWARHQDEADTFDLPDGYEGEEDPRLQEALKKATMTSLYGSQGNQIARKLRNAPDEYGPGLGDGRNIELFLGDAELKLGVIQTKFKPACHEIARKAWTADRFAGVTFTDPFDKQPVRWNPVAWELERVAGSDTVRVYAKMPQAVRFVMAVSPKTGKRHPKPLWEPAEANAVGDYPVWHHKLRTTIGPCLVHMLDSMFAGLVIEELHRRGVHAVVSIHDAWLVPAGAESKLRAAVTAAGEPWLKALEVVYDDLERLLGYCTPPSRGPRKGLCCGICSRWIQELRLQWSARVKRKHWPRFRVGEVRPVELLENLDDLDDIDDLDYIDEW